MPYAPTPIRIMCSHGPVGTCKGSDSHDVGLPDLPCRPPSPFKPTRKLLAAPWVGTDWPPVREPPTPPPARAMSRADAPCARLPILRVVSCPGRLRYARGHTTPGGCEGRQRVGSHPAHRRWHPLGTALPAAPVKAGRPPRASPTPRSRGGFRPPRGARRGGRTRHDSSEAGGGTGEAELRRRRAGCGAYGAARGGGAGSWRRLAR